eukprot:gene5081-3628_t
MFGLGMGLTYTVPISSGVQLLPQHQGVVSGLVVAGFGCGPFIFGALSSRFANPSNDHVDQDGQFASYYPPNSEVVANVPNMYRNLALIYTVVMFVGSMMVSEPDKEEIIHGDLKPENCFIESGSSNMAPAVQQDTILRNRPSSSSVGRSPLPLHRLGPDDVTSNHNSKPLSSIPVDARIKLGDFGNSLHFSEIHQYFEEYEIQSLPYRAPEVLLGLRFTSAIDIWSVGVILIELVIGQTLFHCHNREEAIRDIETTICKLSKTRFSAGKFAHCLFQASRWQAGSPGYVPAPPVTESSQWNRMEQMKSIKRLILRHVSFQSIAPHDLQSLVDFLTSLTAVDPSHRITAFDALQHSFLVAEINLPMSVVIQTVNDAEDAASSSSSKLYKRRRVGTGNPPFHSLKNF